MSVERVGVSFEPSLLKKFDIFIKEKGYTNRSEAIRDLVRKYMIEEDIKTGGDEEVIGTLTILYDHDIGDTSSRLLHFQHHHHSEILYTTHVHIDKHRCLEVIVVKGKVRKVKKLADNIIAIRGVKHGKLVITKTSF